MPRKPTPAGKQRVRTGCLTCRKRRRKCDEQKPRCANCEVKDFACKYGADLAFVSGRSGAAPGQTRQEYGKITFVDDSPLVHARDGKANAKQSNGELESDISGFNEQQTQTSDLVNAHSYPGASEGRTTVPIKDILSSEVQPDLSPEPTPLQNNSGLLLDHTKQGIFSGNTRNHVGPFYLNGPTNTQQVPWAPTARSSHETDLLRHFRYQIGPWLDVGDPDCAFGIQVLLLSRSNRPLQAAILALSASQRCYLPHPPDGDIQSVTSFRKEAEEGLAIQPELVKRAGGILLLLQDVLPVGFHRWRSHIEAASGSFAQTMPTGELGEAVFWLHFRLDLASSITVRRPPVIPFRLILQRDGFLINASHSTIPPQSVHHVYNQALCLLGHTLVLIYGDSDVATPQTTEAAELASFPSLRQSHFLSQWTFLWTDCQKWYNERPVDAQQIVDVRGREADQIEPDHTSSFPILIYTTPVALVANAVYHITSLLLLTDKPRLLKSLPGPRCFTSHIWHAQSIAGIAVSSDWPEQWDPILIAGLLRIATEMTHESQQGVLSGCLARIAEATGINLEQEIEALRFVWSIARYNEDAED